MVASQHTFGADKHGHGASPDNKTFWLSVVAVLGCFLLFIGVMTVAYMPPNDADASGNSEVVQARFTRLEELRAKEAAAAEGYSWVNQPQGVVRIPVALAIELLPQRLSASGLQPKDATPAAEVPATATGTQPADDAAAAETPAAEAQAAAQ